MITVSTAWTGNVGATLTIPLTTDISKYTIKLTTDLPLTKIQFWDADVTPSSGTSFTLTPKTWFGGLSAGSSLNLGFQVTFDGPTTPTFTSIIFEDGSGNSVNMCSGEPGTTESTPQSPPPPPPPTSSTAAPPPAPPSSSTTSSTTSAATESTGGSGECTGKKVVCYFPNWSYYRPGLGSHKVEDIDVHLCTHIIYSFAVLDEATLTMKVYDSWRDIDLKGYEKFVALKKQYPNKKFLIALGGWNDSRTNKYSTMLASPEKRANFVARAVEFIKQYNFDGLDLDYEYPAYQQSASEKTTFAAWVRELKTAFEPHGWELTSAVGAGKSVIDRGYDVPEISKYLDAIHIMTYDMHGSWEAQVDNHAPLYSAPGDVLSVDYAVKYLLSLGAPKEKLIVGIPTYGRSWTLATSSTSIGSPASGPGKPGPIISEAGNLGYQEICMNVLNQGWTVVEDPSGNKGPYAFKGNQWVGYDDTNMARKKAQYVLDNDLGGAMFWDLPSDDFNNRCGEGRYPIISAVNDVLGTKNC